METTPSTSLVCLLKAMNEVMKAVGYVQKTGKNTFHGYRYAGEGELLAALRPHMVEHGLILIPTVEGEERRDEDGNVFLTVSYSLAHTSGEVWPHAIRYVGCGNDFSPKTNRHGDKGVYKALTGANKYALFKLFQIETGDDAEKDSNESGKTHQRRETPAPRRSEATPNISDTNDVTDFANRVAPAHRLKTIRDMLVERDINENHERVLKYLEKCLIKTIDEISNAQATALITALKDIPRVRPYQGPSKFEEKT